MNLSPLLSLLREVPAYRQLAEQLQAAKGEHKAVILDAAKPYLVACLHEELNSPLVVITAQPDNAKKLYEQLQVWCLPSANLHHFPEIDFLPYEYLASYPANTMQRRLQVLSALALSESFASGHSEGAKRPKNLLSTSFRALAHQGKLREESRDPSRSSFASAQEPGFRVTVKQPPLIVTSALAMLSKTIPKREFVSACDILRQGVLVNPLELLHKWQSMGYEMEDVVEVPGTMGRRGGIVDIFPVCSQSPARIEFFGNQIESMRLFNPESQCATKPISWLSITPAKEAVISQAEQIIARLNLDSCAAEARERFEEDMDRLQQHHWFPGAEFYFPLFNIGSIFDYLPDGTLLVLDAPEQIKAVVERLQEQAQDLRRAKLEYGELPQAFPSPYLAWEELESKLKERPYLALEPWNATLSQKLDEFPEVLPFTMAQSYGGTVTFLRKAKQMVEQKERVLVISHRADRLAVLLQEQGLHTLPLSDIKQAPPQGSVTLIRGSLPEGWILDNTLNLITDAELFGFVKQPRPVKRMPIRSSLLIPQLSPGDYVVHVDHGIGRFKGLTKMSTDSVDREYLVLEYAASDKLYVPADQIGRVSRYIGATDQPPLLSRLGTQEWQRTKRRVKESVVDVAQELLLLYAAREVNPGFAFAPDTLWQQELEASFPYLETPDQLEAIMATKEDMEKFKPMDRLICGDVGYGKTEVALRAAFKAVMDDKQVAMLVPTTVLAQQHFTTFKERLQTFPLKVEMLSRFCSPAEERQTLEGLAHGTVDICIGTHRLLQKDVTFRDLGLVIIDEEQRFGVVQKEKLKQMRKEIDVLTLSATPIPRTLHMSLTGIRDMSIMETPPEERLSIKTYVGVYDDALVRQAILRELERNGQVFFVHNRVQSIAVAASKLQALVPEAKIAIAHGQMPEEALERVMSEFVAGSHDVLIATTIIQLGLDMPNVNTLIVDQADKFGLTQLYQLRGRIGRGINQAHAYFLFDKGKQLTPQAHKRLRTIFEATELGTGFAIAMKDLEIRGVGNLLGVKQSGHITAVGFDLYCQLLAEVVEELKAPSPDLSLEGRGISEGEIRKKETEFTPSISLPLTAHIPEEYVSNLNTRLSLYHRLAKIARLEEIENIAQELRDRFGALPQPVKNLLYGVKAKVLASKAEVSSISTQGRQIVIKPKEGVIASEAKQSLSKHHDGVKIGATQIRLDIKHFGNSWTEALEEILQDIACS